MASKLSIPSCIRSPAHINYPPPLEKPLRISIEEPLVAIQELLPRVKWDLERVLFPQPADLELAKLTYKMLYSSDIRQEVGNDIVVQDKYLGWVDQARPKRYIDYYGVTFNHLVPESDPDPEMLMINIIEIKSDAEERANKFLLFVIDLAEFTGEKVLAVP